MSDHRQACTALDGPASQRFLPLDLLLEIAARADAATLVRVAATSKSIRRDILGPVFRSRLLAVRAAASRWFDPALLRGVSYWFLERVTTGTIYEHGVIGTPLSSPPRISVDRLLLELKPVTSRDGFLVLQSRISEENNCDDMCVCDTLTGHVTCLPPVSLSPQKHQHTPALLTDDNGAGRNFELLVANRGMEFQTFSSEAGKWSAVRTVPDLQPPCVFLHRAHPAILGRTVHWFCADVTRMIQIIALDVDAGTTTTQQLPVRDMVGCTSDKEYLLIAVGGQLNVIVVGSLEVSMWIRTTTSASAPAWSRQLVIRTPEIERWAGLDVDSIRAVLPAGGFGERSGTLVLQLKNGDLVRLELRTKEATTIRKGMPRIMEMFLHEMTFASLLQTMKSY